MGIRVRKQKLRGPLRLFLSFHLVVCGSSSNQIIDFYTFKPNQQTEAESLKQRTKEIVCETCERERTLLLQLRSPSGQSP